MADELNFEGLIEFIKASCKNDVFYNGSIRINGKAFKINNNEVGLLDTSPEFEEKMKESRDHLDAAITKYLEHESFYSWG